jgi:hypothetical protein
MIIKDGTGKGYEAKVDSSNNLRTRSIMVSSEHFANHTKGNAYSALFAVNPAGADDVIFYMKNISDLDIVIEGVTWQTSAAEEVYYKLGDSGTPAGTSATIVPANLNSGSGNSAEVTCLSETADAAVDITGLTGGATIEKLWLTSAESKHFNLDQDVIVTKNKVFTIYCVGGDTLLRGTVIFHFAEAV